MFSHTDPVTRGGIIDRRQLRQLAAQAKASGERNVLGADSYTGSVGSVVSVSAPSTAPFFCGGKICQNTIHAAFASQPYPHNSTRTVLFEVLQWSSDTVITPPWVHTNAALLNGSDYLTADFTPLDVGSLYDGFQYPEAGKSFCHVEGRVFLLSTLWHPGDYLRLDLVRAQSPPADGVSIGVVEESDRRDANPVSSSQPAIIALHLSTMLLLVPGDYLFLQVVNPNVNDAGAADLFAMSRVGKSQIFARGASFAVTKIGDAPPGF